MGVLDPGPRVTPFSGGGGTGPRVPGNALQWGWGVGVLGPGSRVTPFSVWGGGVLEPGRNAQVGHQIHSAFQTDSLNNGFPNQINFNKGYFVQSTNVIMACSG